MAKSITTISNADLWDLARAESPTFASHTNAAAQTEFSTKGFKEITRSNLNLVNEWFGILLRVVFQKLDTERVNNIWGEGGNSPVEYYGEEYGGVLQRMSVGGIKPVNPKYRNLSNGSGPDQFKVRKKEAQERFFQKNFDFQNYITVPDEFAMKTAFASERGMGQLVNAHMTALRNSYTVQENENIFECLNQMINDTDIKDTQKVEVNIGSNPTADNLVDFVESVNNVITLATKAIKTGAFNINSFETATSADDYTLLIRAGIPQSLRTRVMSSAFNREDIGFDVKVKEVLDFGGLIPKNNGSQIYPAYDADGAQIGWTTTSGGDVVTGLEPDEYTDPNANVQAVLVQKGTIFVNQSNDLITEPARNAAGRYTDYWMSRPGTTICYDKNYNFVIFENAQTNAQEGEQEGENEDAQT